MGDLTTTQTASSSQPQGNPEKPTEKKEAHLNPVRTVLMILLMLVLGFILVFILESSIFGVRIVSFGTIIRQYMIENLASIPSNLLNIFPNILPKEIFVLLFGAFIFMIGLLPFVLYLVIRFRYINIFIFYISVVLVLLVTWSGALIHEAKALRKQRIEAFENAQSIKAYLPTTLRGKWELVRIDSGEDLVEVFYLLQGYGGGRSGIKRIYMRQIRSPKTDLKCNYETYLEFDKIVPQVNNISKKEWQETCEELSIYGEKSVTSRGGEWSESDWPQSASIFKFKTTMMVFDKGSTRIFLNYNQILEDSLMSTENWSKNDLIRLAENLRPINAKDFKL